MASTRQEILQALRDTRLVDPHSHINPHSPASTTLADILGYHYYTELVHSAGTPRLEIEAAGLTPRELVEQLVPGLRHLTNTAQHAWLIDICQRFFGFQGDVIDESNWENLYDAAESTMRLADWADVVLEKSNVEAVFLTNDFDDHLTGFDTRTYIPCLRTDDLVFHLSKIEVRDRLAVCTGIDLDGSLKSVRDSLEQRFEHFVSHGARACAISLPPDFTPTPVSDGRAATALDAILRQGHTADASHKSAMARRVFWTIVELCDQFQLPMDLMIGVNRGVYAEGVHQGRDLYDSRVSLIQYRELFNAFPQVKFPISVLASVTNQELVSYAWIFPNVLTNGHWWYSNTPSFIRRDAAARLEAVPRNKQIGYYSDAYKLEFIAPKFEMYRNILAGILMDDFVVARGWSEEKAIELGQQILRGNVDTIFPDRSASFQDSHVSPSVGDEEAAGHELGIAIPATATAAIAASTANAWQDDEGSEANVSMQEGSLAFDELDQVAEPEEIDELDEVADVDDVDEWLETNDRESLETDAASDLRLGEAQYDRDPIDETVGFEGEPLDLHATIDEQGSPWLTQGSEQGSATDAVASVESGELELDLSGSELEGPVANAPAVEADDFETWDPSLDAAEPDGTSEPKAAPNDPHATLEMETLWLEEELSVAQQNANDDEAPAAETSASDLTSDEDLSTDPHATFIEEPLKFDFDQPDDDMTSSSDSSGNDIRYFRADESVEVDTSPADNNEAEDELLLEDDEFAGNIFADPVTGELTMPVPSQDADAALDETYQLSDESESESESESPGLELPGLELPGLELPAMDDVIDFDDLELSPMSDDDSDVLVFDDQLADDLGESPSEPVAGPTTDLEATVEFGNAPETEATIEFDDDIEFTFDDPDDDASKS